MRPIHASPFLFRLLAAALFLVAAAGAQEFTTLGGGRSGATNAGPVILPAPAVRTPELRASAGLVVQSNEVPAHPVRLIQADPTPVALRLVAPGAVADYGLQQVRFPADLTEAPIAIATPDGWRLAVRATFLAWHDVASGQRLLVGEVRPTEGMLVGDNTVLYPNAFDTVAADVRYRYSHYAVEQDIILHEALQLPREFQPEHVRLEVWSEWLESGPEQKEVVATELRPEAGSRATPALLGADEQLKFGAARIGAGYAFGLQTEGDKVPVAKSFGRVAGRDWLIEQVDYLAVLPRLEKLPKRQAQVRPGLRHAEPQELIRSLQARSERGQSATLRLAQSLPPSQDSLVLDFVLVSSVPVPADVVSWWPAGGNAQDVYGLNHGTAYGGLVYGAGQVGQGWVLDGGNDHVRVPDASSLDFTTALTVEAWIYPTNVASYRSIVSKWAAVGGNTQRSFDFSLYPGGQFYLLVSPGGTDTGATFVLSTNTVPLNQWTHVAAVYDGSVLRLYRNGVLDGEGEYFGGIFAGANDVGLGGVVGGATPGNSISRFAGRLDEPALYQRALGQAEIQAIYQAGVGGKIRPTSAAIPADLVAWWPGDGHGYDLAGTNHATATGVSYEGAVVSSGWRFNGSSGAVTASDDKRLDVGAGEALTLEAWINAGVNTPDFGVNTIAGKRYAPTISSATGYELLLLEGKPAFQIANANGVYTFTTTTDVRNTGWRHLVVTLDRTSPTGGKFYLDGVNINTFDPTPLSGSLSNHVPFMIGRHPTAWLSCYFQGVVDEVTVYRRALSSAEVTALYAAGSAGKTKADVDNDGLPDWWEWLHFGGITPNPEDDYDGDGTTNLAEFNNRSDPNKIQFETRFASRWVNQLAVNGDILVSRGRAHEMAVQVNAQPVQWIPFQPSFPVSLGTSGDGKYSVRVALRGHNPAAPVTWVQSWITLDRVPPTLTVTAPTQSITGRPVIQLQGSANERLSFLTYDLETAAATSSGRTGFVVAQEFDPARFDYGRNDFQCFDIPLGPGANAITIHATDLAGNTAHLTTDITYDPSSDTTPPVIQVHWPQNQMRLSGDTFYIRGQLDDGTAQITGQVSAGSGVIDFTGVVERDGRFYVLNLPLAAGGNQITLTATDVAGNPATFTFTVTRSSAQLEILSASDGGSTFTGSAVLSGLLTPFLPGQMVVVNGRETPVNDAGYWSVSGVAIRGRTAQSYDATATVSLGNGLTELVHASVLKETPTRTEVTHHKSERHVVWRNNCDGQTPYQHILRKDYDAQWLPNAQSEWEADFYKHWQVDEYQTGEIGMWVHLEDVFTDENPNLEALTVEKASVPQQELVYSDGPWATGQNERHYTWHSYADDVKILDRRRSGGCEPNGYLSRDLTVKAVTKESLYTGGVPGSTEEQLFRIGARAWQLGEPEVICALPSGLPYLYPCGPYGGVPILATEITVGGFRLGSDGYVWRMLPDNAELDVSVRTPAQHFAAATDATKYPAVDLDVDSDNDGSIEAADLEEDRMETNHPGKLLAVNDGDADGDGIPDFADGYELYGTPPHPSGQPSGMGQSAGFTPLALSLPSAVEGARAKVRFQYSASHPSAVTRIDNGDGTHTYVPAPGGLRIWAKDGTQFRKTNQINVYREVQLPPPYPTSYWEHDGDFVAANAEYRATNLTGLYIEGIRPGTYDITVELDPNGESGFITKDTVRVTVLQTTLVLVGEQNNLTRTTAVEISHPSPTITLVACNISTVFSPGPNFQNLQGVLNLSGIVKAAAADVRPSDDNDVDQIFIYINNLDTPAALISLEKFKTENPSSLGRPFDFTGTFDAQILAHLEYGPNLVRVEAADRFFGIKGYTEYVVDIFGQPPTVPSVVVTGAQSSGGTIPESAPPENEWMSYEGWVFPGMTLAGTYPGVLSAQSDGGIFRPYLVEFIGPASVLNDLQSVNFNGVEHRLMRYGSRVFLGLKQHAASQSQIGTVLIGVAADYLEAKVTSADHTSLDYYQGFTLGFCEGGIQMVGDIGTLAIKAHPVSTVWKLSQNKFMTEERQFLINAYKAVPQLAAFWDEWNDRTVEEIMTQDPQADPFEVALATVSEDFRVLGEATKHIIVSVGEQLQQMDSFDRGRVEGRIGFEVVTFLIAEVKAGQAAKVTKVKEIGIVENIGTKVEQAVDAGKLAKGDAALGQKLKDAMAAARARIRQFSKTGTYRELKDVPGTAPGYQRNHLYQDAAVRPKINDPPGLQTIPTDDGLCVMTRGYIWQKGSPHWKFHRWLDDNFWRPRWDPTNPQYQVRPTYAEYDEALGNALRQIYEEPEVHSLLNKAKEFRLNRGLTDTTLMPRIPKLIPVRWMPPP